MKTETSSSSAGGVFSETEYESGNGMITAVWGPAMWHFLHCMSFNFPVHPTAEDKRRYRDFVLSLRYTLPCGKCRENLRENLRKLPLRKEHLQSRDAFARYIFDLHQLVNEMLQKPARETVTFDQVRDRYEHFRARCNSNRTSSTEQGCVEPKYIAKKPQCVVSIVPSSSALGRSRKHIRVNKTCLKRRHGD